MELGTFSSISLCKAIYTLSVCYAYYFPLPLLTTCELNICAPQQFDPVIAAVLEGQPVDLSAMPSAPPGSLAAASVSVGQKEDGERQRASEDIQALPSSELAVAAPSDEPEADIYSAPPAPVSVMEALEQRLSKYRSVEQDARDDGNVSKARRMGRIVKQYENAIKLHSAGKPIPVDDLPTPPGMHIRDFYF
jgi:coiled-coil and C2 domain-containing protein 1